MLHHHSILLYTPRYLLLLYLFFYHYIPREELPPDNDYVIVTIRDDSGDSPYTYVTIAQYYRIDRDLWIADNDYVCGDIIAWMPLPKPYKE